MTVTPFDKLPSIRPSVCTDESLLLGTTQGERTSPFVVSL